MRTLFLRLASLALLTLSALALAPAAAGCSSGSPDGVASACPPGERCQVRLTLLQTADMHSRLLPYDLLVTQIDADLGLGTLGQVQNVGGVARMATILRRERARSDRVLHIDGGDCFQGAPIFNFFSGEPEIRAESLMGTDAMVIANHEFDRGVINIATQIQKWANFPVLAANYRFEHPENPVNTQIGTVLKPFTVFQRGGLRIAVIGMGNLSSLTSIFDQPNRLGITPINTAETAQFYIDLLRPSVDLVVFVTHLGLEVDQRMIRNTTGIDVVLGGHNHIVINPPQVLRDCSADPQSPGYILVPDPSGEGRATQRPCKPRNVILSHSGAFAKFVGRLDLALSNIPDEASPTGVPDDYDPINGFEVISNRYIAFPVDDSIPEEPRVKEMLEPYQRGLDRLADLDLLVGYAPSGVRRIAPQGGDSPLGNMVATAMWLRLGVKTDFSLTNSTGIRADLLPGPITIEQMYNIFPFDNSISKMQLSGNEVMQMFDFVARRSAGRGCTSQAQIAGARVRLSCSGCTRSPDAACAEAVFIGHSQTTCSTDDDCPDRLVGQCDKNVGTGRCLSPVTDTNLYELATSNYLAGGGSGYRVLQRNTTQVDTKIQQRDALIDFIRQGRPCGYKKERDTSDGLQSCSADADCEEGFVCACGGKAKTEFRDDRVVCTSEACDSGSGRCVLERCRQDVAQFRTRRCAGSPPEFRDGCLTDLKACGAGGEACKFLACVDGALGAISDGRLEMIGR